MKIANGKIVVVAVLVGAVIGVGFSSPCETGRFRWQITFCDAGIPEGQVVGRYT